MRAVLRLAALVLCLVAAAAGGEERLARAAAEAPRFVDASPPQRHAAERLDEIRQRIQAAVVYPRFARERAVEGTARVRFDIDTDGAPREVVLHESSGRPSLDRAAAAAVEAAAPLPWVYGRLEVPVSFSLERRR